MRIFARIMLLIVSIQVLMPCMDGLCEHQDQSEWTIAFEAEHEDEGESHADHCSPFCTCSCCQPGYLFAGSNFRFEKAPPITDIPFGTRSLHFSLLDRIWNPPRA